jgi:N6-adenosine-specific RNA methylase IME4
LRRRHYGAILIDPPWKFQSYTPLPDNWRDQLADTRAVERHYEVMDRIAIAGLPLREVAAPACHLFLWTTGPFLQFAMELLGIWGFEFSTLVFNWVKLRRNFDVAELLTRPLQPADFHVGTGFTSRKNTEIVLLGRRGSPRREAKDVRELLLAPVREHSRKPDEIHGLIERYCAGPYLELFACRPVPGWTTWGSELEKIERPAPTTIVTPKRHSHKL